MRGSLDLFQTEPTEPPRLVLLLLFAAAVLPLSALLNDQKESVCNKQWDNK